MGGELRTALVTGAGSGIGKSTVATWPSWACALRWSGATAKSCNSPRRSRARSDTALVATCDITDRNAVKALVEQVLAAFGTIDVLVCNAGTNVRNRRLEALDPTDWDQMIATNLTGSFNLVHHVLPSMRRQKKGW